MDTGSIISNDGTKVNSIKRPLLTLLTSNYVFAKVKSFTEAQEYAELNLNNHDGALQPLPNFCPYLQLVYPTKITRYTIIVQVEILTFS